MSFERENIQRMSGYVSGEQPESPDTIKLNTNENPYPASAGIREILADFDPADLRRYPPATSAKFRQLAAELNGLSSENVIATRGGDELLRLAITTFVDPHEKIGVTYPTYSLYPILAQIQDCPLVEVQLDEHWQLPQDFAAQMNASDVRLTLLVNPHAPSGQLLRREQIEAVAGELNSILLLDEAYIDFVDHDYPTADLVTQYDNIIILRPLSKGYSLAGLRFGYGLGASSLIEPMLTKTRDSYNLDLISQLIAEVALIDQATASESWRLVIEERNRLARALHDLGFNCPDSQANFLLAKVPDNQSAEALYTKLKERHILVRYFNSPRLDDKLRISIGSRIENDRLINALKEIL